MLGRLFVTYSRTRSNLLSVVNFLKRVLKPEGLPSSKRPIITILVVIPLLMLAALSGSPLGALAFVLGAVLYLALFEAIVFAISERKEV